MATRATRFIGSISLDRPNHLIAELGNILDILDASCYFSSPMNALLLQAPVALYKTRPESDNLYYDRSKIIKTR